MSKLPTYGILSDVAQYRDMLNKLGQKNAITPGMDDVIFAAIDGQAVATMAMRPLVWIHSLTVNPTLLRPQRTLIVPGLIAYGRGLSQQAMLNPKGALFQVSRDNVTMRNFASSLGGINEPECEIYRIDYQ